MRLWTLLTVYSETLYHTEFSQVYQKYPYFRDLLKNSTSFTHSKSVFLGF